MIQGTGGGVSVGLITDCTAAVPPLNGASRREGSGGKIGVMSAKDIFHEPFVRALTKDGWTITHDPLIIPFGKRDLEEEP